MSERETKHEAAPRNEPPKANAGATATKRKDALGAGLEEGNDVVAGILNLLGQITGQMGLHKGSEDEIDALHDEIDRRAREFAENIAAGTVAQPPSN